MAMLHIHAVIFLPQAPLPEPHSPVAAACGYVVAAGGPGNTLDLVLMTL